MYFTEELITALEKRLQYPLPGWNAQRQMATETHRRARLKVPSTARQAGVLLLLYPGEQSHLYFPLIKRPTYNGAHSGQIAFPGGKIEPQDQSIVDTALRETQEEIGVEVGHSQVLGQLSNLYIPVSRFVVSPVVAFTNEKPQYQCDPVEVADTLDVAAHDFLNTDKQAKQEIKVGEFTLEAPTYVIQDQIIWGATAMMLAEFSAILEDVL
ncbi:MAG: NUDIX hydrolase [Cyclobacteriaceae bacterium]